jgi:hypothetical protein
MIRALLAAAAIASVTAVSQQPAKPPATTPPAPVPAQPGRVNAEALLGAQFVKRVEDYVALHKKLEAKLPPRPEHATPEQVDAHARALSKLLAEARPRARQGNMLPSDTRAYLRRQIARALSGPDRASIRQEITEDNPGRVKLQVNSRYPDGVPLTTMPPSVLAELPRLPEDVEYRFIGTRLILLDVHAQLVVDYMDAAIPG